MLESPSEQWLFGPLYMHYVIHKLMAVKAAHSKTRGVWMRRCPGRLPLNVTAAAVPPASKCSFLSSLEFFPYFRTQRPDGLEAAVAFAS